MKLAAGDAVRFESINTKGRYFRGRIVGFYSGGNPSIGQAALVDDGTGRAPRPVSLDRLERIAQYELAGTAA